MRGVVRLDGMCRWDAVTSEFVGGAACDCGVSSVCMLWIRLGDEVALD